MTEIHARLIKVIARYELLRARWERTQKDDDFAKMQKAEAKMNLLLKNYVIAVKIMREGE